ncbi:MAG: pyrroline-5-carboxylate reductase dimerization domain-containing protein [Paracoccaceae bacterium]
MKLGVLGVGHLAATLLKGWDRAGVDPARVILSPRGHGPDLAAARGYGLAADNADLVARADLVVLAVRPAAAVPAVTGLPWRAGQVILSACAGVPIAALAQAAPGARVVRIMPLTAAEIGRSPTAIHPDDPQARPWVDMLGPVIPLPREEAFEIATVSAAIYGWAQDLIARSAGWSAAQGLEAETARLLVARTFEAAGALLATRPEPMEQLLQDLVTPGGITERGLQVLGAAAVPEAWDAACQAVLDRLRG